MPDADQLGCPGQGRVAIGFADATVPDAATASARFRRQRAALQARADWTLDGALVCGDPLTTWRDDLLVQPVFAAGTQIATLVGGRAADDPVLELTPIEWLSFEWRAAGDSRNHNFTGVPIERITLDGYPAIRTDRGALVMVRPDTPGLPVVNGAWDVWMARGGPSGSMGIPKTIPTGKVVGGAQAFQHGTLVLPEVTDPYEAAARPADDYEWQPLGRFAPTAEPLRPNQVIEVRGRSFYVGPDLDLHWIRTSGDWNCTKWNYGADLRGEVPLALFSAPAYGAPFVCEK